MSAAAFPSPTSEMAEMNRIHYELEYTAGISQKMRIPEMLKVAPPAHVDPNIGPQEVPHSVLMQVPERIIIAGDSNEPQYSLPRDLDLIQSAQSLEALSLKTPPRVLTLTDRPLDFMEEEQRAAPDSEELLRPQARARRERSASENAAVRQKNQLVRSDSGLTPSPRANVPCIPLAVTEEEHNLYSTSGVLSFIQSTTRRAYRQVLEVLDENPRSKASLRVGSAPSSNPLHESRLSYEATLEGVPDDMAMVDVTAIRRQLVKLHRRLHYLEEEKKERVKREMILYSINLAFWIINTWVWLRR